MLIIALSDPECSPGRRTANKEACKWVRFIQRGVSPAVVRGHGALREGKHWQSDGCGEGDMKGR